MSAPPQPGPSAAAPPGPSASLATLHPATFAMVMATGIVSVACHLTGLLLLASFLFWLNVFAYVVIWIASILRLVFHPKEIAADLRHHGRCVGFFTVVAGTCVLGTQFLIIAQRPGIALALWLFGIGLWAALTYGIFTILTIKKQKPTLAEGINGGWLLAVVAAQSVAVLGAQLAPGLGSYQMQALLFSLVVWLGGGMLYIWIISLIFYRYTFFTLSPAELAPPYWVNMGAVAISTLAGTMLAAAAPYSPLLSELLPFIKGFTLFFWATATWWIPMLLILGIWRHLYCRFPLRYDPLYWGLVFPLGMYTACTYRLAQVVDAPFLVAIPRVFIYVALAAWALTLIGLVRALLRLIRPGSAVVPGKA